MPGRELGRSNVFANSSIKPLELDSATGLHPTLREPYTAMTEDELYRSSTQYRLWSFTPEALAALRASTNATAAKRVRAGGVETATNGASKIGTDRGGDGGQSSSSGDVGQIDCLTVEEEQKLVEFYCVKAMDLADFCSFPTNVKARQSSHHPKFEIKTKKALTSFRKTQATAVQYLKRFYLANSPMTYHPKQIMPCALFLATKTENHYTPLSAFAAKLDKTTSEDVVGPEFLLTQGLRFTFDVRHPFRGLEGGFMEMLALAEGKGKSVALGLDQEAFFHGLSSSSESVAAADDIRSRIRTAHTAAKDHLKTSAQLSDAYFLYTPAQIWLAAVYVVDKVLARAYLDSKFPTIIIISSKDQQQHKKINKTILIQTIHDLASLLHHHHHHQRHPGDAKAKIAEMKRIGKKLFACHQNPKPSAAAVPSSSLRGDDVVMSDDDQQRKKKKEKEEEEEEKGEQMKTKKRRLERERYTKEAEDVFGPPSVLGDGGS